MRSRVEHVAAMMALAGNASLRVQTRADVEGAGKAAGPWFMCRNPDTHYHLRAILPCELVFDIGDHAPFPKAAEWANAVSQACIVLGVPSFWVALSAGKGIHIHIFGHGGGDDTRGQFQNDIRFRTNLPAIDSDEPSPFVAWEPAFGACDWRGPVSRRIMEEAVRLCGDWDMECDPLLVQPNDEARMCREFGAQKDRTGTDRKTLWFDSALGFPYEPIPPSRDAAYAAARLKNLGFPRQPAVADLSHLDPRWLPSGCPKSPLCHDEWNFCNACPLGA